MRASYGQEATGAHLERHFADPPYGARIEVVQALCAAALRTGLLETVYQGQRITNPGDARLDQVFGAVPRFRAAAFRPPADTDVPLERRIELAEKLEQLTGERPSGHATEALAVAVRQTFVPDREAAIRVQSVLNGLGLRVPEMVSRTHGILDRLTNGDDMDVVTTAHDTWADLVAGQHALARLDELLATSQEDLRAAHREARRSPADLPDRLVVEHQELQDLLAAGNLADHAARIVALARKLAAARQAATRDAADRLISVLRKLRIRLRDQYGDLDEAALTEALRPLDDLAPPDDLNAIDATTLEARIDSARAGTAGHQLEELRSAGRVAWVRVIDLVADAITNEEELDAALARIREAIAAELADGKQVRFQ
jgi:hypothetical protein